jgi:ABC-type multidrug transport system ATPase subunit
MKTIHSQDYNAITMRSVNLDYKLTTSQSITIFNNLDFQIQNAEKAGIIGPSGSGKSTLLRLISGTIKPDNGIIQTNNKVGVVEQEPILNPWLTVIESLAFILNSNDNIRCDDLLKKIDLIDQKHQLVKDLSFGQRQRVAFILSILSGNKIILADEPLSRLDFSIATQVLQNIFDLVKSSTLTLVMATHNYHHLKNFDSIYQIKDFQLKKISFQELDSYYD